MNNIGQLINNNPLANPYHGRGLYQQINTGNRHTYDRNSLTLDQVQAAIQAVPPISSALRPETVGRTVVVKVNIILGDSDKNRIEFTVRNNDLVEGDLFSTRWSSSVHMKADLVELDDEDTAIVTYYMPNNFTLRTTELAPGTTLHKMVNTRGDEEAQDNWARGLAEEWAGNVTITTGAGGMGLIEDEARRAMMAQEYRPNSVLTMDGNTGVVSLDASGRIPQSIIASSGTMITGSVPGGDEATARDVATTAAVQSSLQDNAMYFDDTTFVGEGTSADPIRIAPVYNDLVSQMNEMIARLNRIENGTNQGST